MTLQPRIAARFNKFRTAFSLTNVPDGEAFEQFVNYVIITNQQTSSFATDSVILDLVNAGGYGDLGLDGIVIKVNDIIIQTLTDIDDILERQKKISVEFIFIQSKYKTVFSRNELQSFLLGVERFLSQEAHEVVDGNSKISFLLSIKARLFADDSIIKWKDTPEVKLYFVQLEKEPNRADVDYMLKSFSNTLNTIVVDCKYAFSFLNGDSLVRICEANERHLELKLPTVKFMSFKQANGVDNSLIAVCNAQEYVDILKRDDGSIIKSIFEDNVRDYQGENNVNTEMLETLSTAPQKFLLLNNGVTIVCEKFSIQNEAIFMENPQVVNGCQTSHILFEAAGRGIDIQNVQVTIKVIATQDSDISNSIVKGSNRQSIVQEEAFETTRQFHKDLSDFFLSANSAEPISIYYERRSRQYDSILTIAKQQIISFRQLIQSYVGVFLEKPYLGHRHESVLLRMFKNEIFLDGQSLHQYYLSALLAYKLETQAKKFPLPKELHTYRAHILMITKVLLGGYRPKDINDKFSIENYSISLYQKIFSDFENCLKRSYELFKTFQDNWVVNLGNDRFALKESQEFTEFILNCLKLEMNNTSIPTRELEPNRYYESTIVLTRQDKNGQYYGFISHNPENIWFHQKMNRELQFPIARGQKIRFQVFQHATYGKLNARNVSLIS